MNLDLLTCIQKFEVPIQVANATSFNKYSKTRFEFEIEIKKWTVYYTEEHYSYYSDTGGAILILPCHSFPFGYKIFGCSLLRGSYAALCIL
jgi:hypothetical protein